MRPRAAKDATIGYYWQSRHRPSVSAAETSMNGVWNLFARLSKANVFFEMIRSLDSSSHRVRISSLTVARAYVSRRCPQFDLRVNT
jgi:hypothetical protein